MEEQTKFSQEELYKLAKVQAIDQDYATVSNQYDRGHLNPSCFNSAGSDTATFTLTNAVPQVNTFNQGIWAKLEIYLRTVLTGRNVRPDTSKYIVTGAVRGDSFISNGRVNVPSHMWTAACIVSPRGTVAFGYLCPNAANQRCTLCTVSQLRQLLTKLNDVPQIFQNDCEGPNNVNLLRLIMGKKSGINMPADLARSLHIIWDTNMNNQNTRGQSQGRRTVDCL